MNIFFSAKKDMNPDDSSYEEHCHCCGKCCLADFIAYVRDEDILRWKKEGRTDILSVIENEHAMWVGDHLISAVDGRYLHGCPFLTWEKDRSACSIYETRPAVCRNYVPASSEICPQWKQH
ncbi:MAG: YkgJ family cysteine cluster protein [Syntrophales bacterium]